MINKSKVLYISILFLLFNTLYVYSQNYNIDYYGIVADGVDDNMSKMTSDLYFTQLCEINNFNVSDKRTDTKLSSIPSSSSFNSDILSLYAIISKKDNSNQWISTITLYDGIKKVTNSESKEYDSFYKILMEPKSTLQDTIKSLLSQSKDSIQDVSSSQQQNNTVSTEFLSGTWTGEDTIEKIVIMRGGRGFVIFKNGASMNITVETQQSTNEIVILQKGNSNASFYSELPREVALKEAVNASPIKWTFKINDNDTLTGLKSTLIQSGSDVINGTVNVTWKRKS